MVFLLLYPTAATKCNVPRGGLFDPAEPDAESWHRKIIKTKPGVFLQI